VLGDPALRARLVERGRTRARVFTWELAARRTRAVYDAVHGSTVGAGRAGSAAGATPA